MCGNKQDPFSTHAEYMGVKPISIPGMGAHRHTLEAITAPE